MAVKQRPMVDERSFELAEHFLSELEGDEASEDQKWELADCIQSAVEGWFEGRSTHSGEADGS